MITTFQDGNFVVIVPGARFSNRAYNLAHSMWVVQRHPEDKSLAARAAFFADQKYSALVSVERYNCAQGLNCFYIHDGA